MRVLWLCNIMLPMVAEKLHVESNVKEGWITGILTRLIKEGKNSGITLGIAFPANENLARFHDVYVVHNMPVECYGFYENMEKTEQYQPDIEQRMEEIVNQFQPDIVHVFGTEYPHALSMARVFPHSDRLLVGIQGVISWYGEQYLADLPKEVYKSRTFRDIIRKDSILQQQEKFLKRGDMEIKTTRIAGNITGRTVFDKAFSESVNPDAVYYSMNETMRSCFYEGEWSLEKCRKHQIFISQADYPIKGFHYLLQALPAVLKEFPDTKVKVSGNKILRQGNPINRLKISAYAKYLKKEIKKYGLEDKIVFLGKLPAEQMKEQYLECHTFVCPSVLENSPNSVAEAMLLGTPVVAARVGGIPSMITDCKDGLLYTGGNTEELAQTLIRLWKDEGVLPLAGRLSKAARVRAKQTHDPETNFKRLMEIYQDIYKRAENKKE